MQYIKHMQFSYFWLYVFVWDNNQKGFDYGAYVPNGIDSLGELLGWLFNGYQVFISK